MDQEFIERVRELANIVDIISGYINLKKAGKSWKGRCPFHPDKTPSFYVDEDKGVYHCFGCGASGNVFRFVMEMEKLTFPEALQLIAKRYGIPIPERKKDKMWTQIEEIMSWAQRLYMSTLYSTKGEGALRYMKGRKFDEVTLKKFGVGYAPPSGNFIITEARKKGIHFRLLREGGLLREGENGEYFDYFRDRILFPIRTTSGKIIGFGGRGLAQNALPKYINSPDTKVFKKGEVLFGLPEAKGAIREKKEAWIVEGYIDLLALHQAGFENVVAPLGTALTEGQSRLLSRYTKRAVLLFDGDEAGKRAAKRSLPLLVRWSVVPKVGLVPEGEDPASLVEKGNAGLIEEIARSALDLVPFYIQEGFEESDTSAFKEKLEEVLDAVAMCTDPVLTALYLRELSKRAGLMEDYLKAAIGKRKGAAPKFVRKKRERLTFEFRLLCYSLLDEETRKKAKKLRKEDIRDKRAKELFELVLSNMTKEEILAEARENLREEIIEVLLEAPDDIEAIRRRLDVFIMTKELEGHKKALYQAEKEGDGESVEKHLREINRIKTHLRGKGGI